MLQSSIAIDDLCAHIKKIGVTYFSHTRIFDDGSRFDLNNNPVMIEQFYFNKDEIYKAYAPEVNPRTVETDIVCLDSFHNNKAAEFLRECYGIDHMIVKIDKHDGYCDSWNFGTSRNNHGFYATFFRNQEMIKLFIEFYLSKAEDIIEACSKDRIIVVSDSAPSTNDIIMPGADARVCDEVHSALLAQINKLKIGSCEHLTKTEIRCCQLLLEGMSRKEIANILCKSPRTIDTHIQNIRQKLNCSTKAQMMSVLRSMGFIRALSINVL
jgi:LuxR family quorum-sensing system transcriptional regulator SolR